MHELLLAEIAFIKKTIIFAPFAAESLKNTVLWGEVVTGLVQKETNTEKH